MNISQVENPRLVIWMDKIGITEVPKHFGEYMAFISNNVSKYTKEKGINHVVDHDDFTKWLKQHG